MAASSYDGALRRVLAHEGGNDDDPRDPGGRTSRGILQREWNVWRKTHPGLPADVWRAPQDQIEAVYRQKYWEPLRCDDLPAGVDYATFDYGVNSGIGRAGKVLRRLLGLAAGSNAVTDDVVAAVNRGEPKGLISAICDERLAFLQGLSTWTVFGKGWGRRVREVRAAALAMAGKPAGSKRPLPQSAKATLCAPGKGQQPPVPTAKRFSIGASVVAAIGAVAHWVGGHPTFTGGAVVVSALVVLVVVRRFGNGD